MNGTLLERINHKLFGTHYTKWGSPISPLFWRFQDSTLIGVPCVVCKQTISRPKEDDPGTDLIEAILRALKIPQLVDWLAGRLR